jgi:hypothetical protein
MEVLNTLQYLPIPLLVLSPEKTVIFASETMITLLGIDLGSTTSDRAWNRYFGLRCEEKDIMGGLSSFTQRDSSIRLLKHLQGFLDLVIASPASFGSCRYPEEHEGINDIKSSSPMSDQSSYSCSSSLRQKGLTDRMRATVHDIAMEVVITPLVFRSDNQVQRESEGRLECKKAVQATCTVTTSTQESLTYFTLIFACASKPESSYNLQSPTGGADQTESRLGLHESESNPTADIRFDSISKTLLKDSTTILQQSEFSPSFSAPACIQRKASQLKDAI